MKLRNTDPEHTRLIGSFTSARYAHGPLSPFLSGSLTCDIGRAGGALPQEAAYDTVFAGYQLQDIANYRAAIQSWFAAVRAGGHLVITVPHAFLYERQNALPSRWSPRQRRLYTPRSLLEEIEEALAPNSYRVRLLSDDDAGYDYAMPPAGFPQGRHDVILALQKIEPPAWALSERFADSMPASADRFEPLRTRVEAVSGLPACRILILKLDHLGDFIMGTAALRRARDAFPDADITLVVGSWNVVMAEALGLFNRVVAFDAFPRNSSEEKDDVRGKVSEFEALITAEYDLAIDLRVDHDTRVLLDSVRARIRAGIGPKSKFDFLDIFLPIDGTRGCDAAWERQVPIKDFAAQKFCTRNRFEICCEVPLAPHDNAITWGPYYHLDIGRYVFEPYAEFDWRGGGLIRYDVALDIERVFDGALSGGELGPVSFVNKVQGARFEFRFWSFENEKLPKFKYFGGRLAKEGAASVLHQSEYLALLIELVAMRVSRQGVLQEWRDTP